MARAKAKSKHLRKGNRFKRDKAAIGKVITVLLVIVLSGLLLATLFTQVLPILKYSGTSMEPTLTDGQYVLAIKTDDIESGDIIAFYYNNSVLVRRVIATEGQQVSVDLFGTVTVDGQELQEPYIADKTLGQSNQEYPCNVPLDSYFVMGDNRTQSMDSRLQEIGTVNQSRIIGKLILY